MAELTAVGAVPSVRAGTRLPHWAGLGILFGLLSAASIVLWGPIGVSGTYPRAVGEVLRAVDPAYARLNPYVTKMGGLLTPETMLVVGLFIGGFLASRLGGAARRAPALEVIHAHEHTRRRRYLDAFAGGLLIIFGARLAGGCTSGHIISGVTQLAASGLLFGAGVFASGILTATRIRGVGGEAR